MHSLARYFMAILLFASLSSCQDNSLNGGIDPNVSVTAIEATFASTIDLNNLPNYANQNVPNYIDQDNTPNNNPITDIGASLGRVLFYDNNLSSTQTVSCASCHQQESAFGDLNAASIGVAGTTGRHSMRLVNARFVDEENFFWDERAESLEEQSTMPIQDHIEMGFSGQDGDQDFNDLIARLNGIDYYPEFFELVFGDPEITENRMQLALSQFVRSIQSFDSKYDDGRAQVNNNGQPFPNFTDQENQGKQLFMQNPDFADGSANRVGGGAGCNRCHNAPEFDIDGQQRLYRRALVRPFPVKSNDPEGRSSWLPRSVFHPAGFAQSRLGLCF